VQGTGKGGNGNAKVSSRHSTVADDVASASASALSAMAMWMPSPNIAASPGGATVSGEQQVGEQDSNAGAMTPATSALATATADSAGDTAAMTAAVVTADAAVAVTQSAAGPGSSSADHSSAANAATTADLAALASLVRGQSDGGTQTGAVQHTIAVPISDPAWPHAVAAQVQLFAAANMQSATLRLSPEHLGPVEVHLDMQASQVNVSFVAAHAETRSALEQSVPMLRAMLAHGGLTLGQTQVQGETRSGSQSFNPRAQAAAGASTIEQQSLSGVTRSVGLVDEYA
jgi:flagellar hook-length control protein FliK